MALIEPPLTLLPDARPLIGDQRIANPSGGEYEHRYAATGKPTRPVPLGGQREMDAAVQAARHALPRWQALPPNERRDMMLRLCHLITENAEPLTALQILENAVPRMFASRFPQSAVDYLAYNAGWVDKIGGEVVPTWPSRGVDFTLDEPYGVVAVIVPWNGPLPSLGQVLGPALAAGNTVVVKPPELAPFTALRFGELVLEAGFPPGVVNVVPAGPEGGSALVRHPGVDKIHFTGSSGTAKKILAGALENLTPVGLELGGKSALLVFPDADLLAAARQAVSAAIIMSGQGCTNSTRLLVDRTVYERLLRIVRGLIKHTVVGDPYDMRTFMGPVVSAAACDRIMGVIAQARESGAGRLAVGGERLGGELASGYFISPTLFVDVDNKSDLAQNEIFGPVVAAMSFDTEEQAVQLANDTCYGLAAYVYTNDLDRALRVGQALMTGNVWINGFEGIPPSAPFGGIKQSGYGRLGGIAGIREFTRPKNLWMSVRRQTASTPNEAAAV